MSDKNRYMINYSAPKLVLVNAVKIMHQVMAHTHYIFPVDLAEFRSGDDRDVIGSLTDQLNSFGYGVIEHEVVF